jgi:ABC-type nitrate/sulfonate/bicarbonate transport system substrate-binding protein
MVLAGLLLFPASLAAAEKLRVGFPSLATALSPSWVAVKQGLWKKYDLDVELIYLSGAITIPSLMSNSVQVVLGSDSEAVIGMLKGAEIVRLGVTTNSLGSSLVTRPNVSSFAQLKGRAIGIGSCWKTASILTPTSNSYRSPAARRRGWRRWNKT